MNTKHLPTAELFLCIVHDCHEHNSILLIENQFVPCYAIKTIFMLGKNDFE
jgi:hypothetical protein